MGVLDFIGGLVRGIANGANYYNNTTQQNQQNQQNQPQGGQQNGQQGGQQTGWGNNPTANFNNTIASMNAAPFMGLMNSVSSVLGSVFQQTAYQMNLAQPKEEKWYKGETPTSREIYGRIGTLTQTNPEGAAELASWFERQKQDPTSQYYNQYDHVTNRSVSALAAMGLDVNHIDDEWLENTSYLANYLIFNGTTNEPSKPGRKASLEQQAAYEWFQVGKANDKTNKARNEWAACQEEMAYLANDPRNYSENDIMEAVFGKGWQDGDRSDEFKRKYPTLAEMDASIYGYGKGLVELNDVIGYSIDNAQTAIWKARNNGGTGNWEADLALSAGGYGNQWTEDPEIAAKLNVNDSSTYSPYSVGMTLKKAGTYFNVYEFTPEVIAALEANPHWDDETWAENMRSVQNAFKTTEQAKEELAAFQRALDKKLKGVKDPNQAEQIIDNILNNGYYDSTLKRTVNFNTLKALDSSIASRNLIDTTSAIDYRKQDKINYALGVIEENAGRGTGTDVKNNIAGLQNEQQPAVLPATETETAIAESQDQELSDARGALYDDAGDMEKAVMDGGWSVTYEGVKNLWDNMVGYGKAFINNLSNQAKDAVLNSHSGDTLASMQSMYDYEKNEEEIQALELELDALKHQYGDDIYLGKEVEADIQRTVNIGGQDYLLFLSNAYGEDGYTLMAADQFSNGNESGVDNDTLEMILNSPEYADAVANANAEASMITSMQGNLSYSEDYRNEVSEAAQRMRSLELQIEDKKQQNAQNADQYQRDVATFEASQRKLEQQIYVMNMLGMDTSDMEQYEDTIAYLADFADYEATVWSAYNPSDAYRIALAEGEDRDAVYEAAKKGNDAVLEELERAKANRDYIEQHNLNIPQNYLNNLDRHIAKLERNAQDYEDFLLSKNDDWEEMIAKGRREEYENRPQQWSLFRNPELDWSEEEYYQHLNEDNYDEMSAFADYGLRGIAGIFARQMTEDEKNTYYYLMGKGEKDRAAEYVSSLMNMSYGVLHTRYTNELREGTEGMLREEKSQDFATKEDADKWIAENGEKFKDYNLTQDENGYHISWSQSRGAGAFIGTNILAVLASPAAAMASLGYMGYSLISGDEINPDNALLAANTFRSATREQSAKEISDYYGEGTAGQKIVQMFYEMVSNRLDSAINGVTFGGLASGIGNEMLQEFLGASPMGFSAAMDSMMEAKRKGASDAQAYGVGLVTFLAETGTEAISLDNMKKAFKLGEEVTGEGLRSFLKNWLTESGISEMLGESASDIIGNLADEAIMGELSDHKDRVWSYRMKGYEKEDAEAMARRDEMNGVMRTALMSYLSPGMDIVSYGVGRADYYRQKTRARQQAGYGGSIIQTVQDERNARIEAERAADEAVNDPLGSFDLEAVDEELARREARDRETDIAENGMENGEGRFVVEDADIDPALLQSKTNPAPETTAATEETQEEAQEEAPSVNNPEQIASEYNALESVKGADSSSQSATISSVLDAAKTEASGDMANTAAMRLGDMLGEDGNPAEFVQNLLLGAEDSGTDAALVKQAIQNAALGGEASAAWQMMQTDEYKNADYGDQAVMLASTVEADSQNQVLGQEIGKNVHDYRVVEAEKGLLKNGFLDTLKNVQAKAAEAAKNLQMAQESLKEKQDELQAKSDALMAATEEVTNNPTADNQHAHDRALNEYNKADIVAQEYEQHLAAVERANTEAKENARRVQETAMRDLRQQAEAVVADQDQQRAERAAQQAEQARIDAEIQEKTMKAARELSNFSRLNAEDIVDDMFPNISGDDRKYAIGLVMETQKAMSSSSDSWMARGSFAKSFAKKFGINQVEVVQNAPYNARINPQTKKLEISSNATQSDIMYAVMIHELTHIAESSDTYNELADAVLQMKYGDDVTFQGILQQMKAGDLTSKLAQDILGKKGIYDGYLKRNHSYEEMLQEIVADQVGYTISGDQDAINNLVAEKPSLARRILDSIKSFLRKAVGMDDGVISQAQKAADLLEKALKDAGTKRDSIGVQSADRSNGDGTKYRIIEYLTNEILTSEELRSVESQWNNYKHNSAPKDQKNRVIELSNGGAALATGDSVVYTDSNGRPELVIRAKQQDEMVRNDLINDALDFAEEESNFGNQYRVLTSMYGEKDTVFGIARGSKRYLGQITRGAGFNTRIKSERVLSEVSPEERYSIPAAKNNGTELTSELPGGTITANIAIPSNTEGTQRYSLSSWTDQEITKVRQNLLKNGFTATQADKWIGDVNSIAAVIAADKERLDFTPDRTQKFKKPNGDVYKWTLDASTLCAKRLLYQGTFNEIQKLMPNTPLYAGDLIELSNMMREMGYQTPCGICYVESQRRDTGKFTEEFIAKYSKEHEGEFIPTYADLTTSDGLYKLRDEHPEVYNAYIKANNARGSASTKPVQLRTDYRGDVRSLTKDSISYLKNIGGLRIQSFSDFETPHLMDMMQAVLDMSAVGLTSQAYTKVPNFAWVFGDTGIKINLSLMGEGTGVDENGNLIFSSTEGMDFDEAMKLRDKYSKNVGTILVGMNDAHILAAMADPRIDYIIPFHRSGWSEENRAKMTSLANYKDYQDFQNERDIKTGKKAEANIEPGYVVKPDGTTDGYWDYNKTGKENAEAYLKLCAEKGLIPKFEQFLVNNGDGSYSLQPDGSTDGYWKLLIDFKMYDNDGIGSPQQSVTPNINMPEAYRVLDEFDGTGVNSLPVAQPVVDRYVEEYKKNHPLGEGRERYSLPAAVDNVFDEMSVSELRDLLGLSGGTEEETRDIVTNAVQDIKDEFDPTIYNGKLYVKPETLDHWLSGGGFASTNPDYAQAYITTMNPADFLRMTTASESGQQRILDEATPLDVNELSDEALRQPIQLIIDEATGSIEGHEGRHRSVALARAGVTEIPVLLFDSSTKYNKTAKPEMTLQGQSQIPNTDNGNTYTFRDVIPLSNGNRDEIFQKFTASAAEEAEATANSQRILRYSLPSDAPYLSAVNHGDMEEAQRMVDSAADQSMPNSKARDENGNLLKLYHGTEESFNEFKPNEYLYEENGESKIKGYFSEDEDYASRYGETSVFYVNIENPLEFGDTPWDQTKEDWIRWFESKGITEIKFDSSLETDSLKGADWGNGIKTYSVFDIFDGGDYWGGDGNLTERIEAAGYDGMHWDYDEAAWVPFNEKGIKSADVITYDESGNPIPLSERFNEQKEDVRYSLPSEDIMRQQIQYRLENGVTEPGSNVPGQPTTLPGMPNEGGSAQRQFGAQTAQQSDALHQSVKDYLYTHSDYTPDSNRSQIDRSMDWVRSKATESDPDGYRAALEEVLKPEFDYRSADGQARMLTVMSMAALKAQSGDETAMADELRLADAYNQQGTDLGRQLQARKIFRLMTPLGRRQTLQQEVAKINQEYANSGKDTRVELSDWTLKAAEAAQTEEDFAKVQKAAERELAAQMPANWKEKLRTWRMLSMLANPRTHIRNVLGNGIFQPVVGLKNAIGAGLESTFVKEGGERTKAIRYTDDAKDFAKQDVLAMKDVLTGEAKYSPESKIEQNKKAFGQGKGLLSRTVGKAVQAVADFNSNMLEKEDWVFLNKHYRNALASYMTANGLTSADMTGQTLEKARTYAVLEAQKATYRDANAVSSWLNKASRRGGVGGFLVDTVLPFKKTPANILRRGIEYSPVGLIQSFATAKKSLDLYAAWEANGRKGNMPKGAKSMTEVLDGIASGLTGTAVAALGALGYALGAVKLGFGGDDDDELEKERGSQEYSVELFGHSFTIDWAAPVCMPFFTGASLYKEFSENIGNIEDVEDATGMIGRFINSLSAISEPVFNLSMLDGVSSLLKSASSTQKDKIPVFELLQNIGANYVGSLVPSALGAAARTIDTTRRQNYVESGDPLRIWKQKIEQAENKIPWLSMRNIPYRDVWGEADVSAPGEAFIENFLLPGYLNEMSDDKLTQELQRIYDQTGDNAVIPKTASKTVGNKKLTDQEYDQYVVTRGQTAKELLNDLIGRDEFIALTPTDQSEGNPEAQVALIGEVWKYANAVARHEIDPEYKMDKWIAGAYAGNNPIDTIFAREDEKAQKAYATQAKNDLFTAIAKQDAEAIGTSLEGLRQSGKDDKGIRNDVMNYFRDQYKEAYRTGDQETMDAIKYGMLYMDLGEYSFTDDDDDPKSIFITWRKAVDGE